MGTTTFYLKYNDFGRSLSKMTKKEMQKLSNISPYGEEQSYLGWRVPLELHNGNIYLLVFWKGKLMKLEKAPQILNKKYYDRYRGKTVREYEWTLLKRMILNEVNRLDKGFRKVRRSQIEK